MEVPNSQKKIRKRFFSSEKECAWLNRLGEDGYRLLYRQENSYTFELTEDRLYYSVEWLDCSPESEEGLALIQARAEEGATLETTYSLWAYFSSPAPLPLSDAAKKRNAVRYRNTAFIFFALDLITSVLIAYQFAIRGFLEKQSVFMEAPEYEAGSFFLAKLAQRILYGGEVLLYRYSKLFSGLFGETKATVALSILLPLAVIFAVMGAIWLNEWLRNRSLQSSQEEYKDAVQGTETSGEIALDR